MSIQSQPELAELLLIDDLSGSHSSTHWFYDNSTAHEIFISRQDVIDSMSPYVADYRLIPVTSLFLPRERLDAHFVVSLEPPGVFPGADFYLAVSRAVAHPASYGRGPCYMVARQGAHSWTAQLASLKRELSERASTPSITVLDDGFAGGLSLIWLYDQLQRTGIEVDAFAIAFNTYAKQSLCNKPVIGAGSVPWASRWLHARDLIWGAPGSGMGLLSDTGHVVGGVPYSLLRQGFSDRTGLDKTESSSLRTISILLSDEIYRRWEVAGDRFISASIVSRLGSIFRDPDQRVRSLLESCNTFDDEIIVGLLT